MSNSSCVRARGQREEHPQGDHPVEAGHSTAWTDAGLRCGSGSGPGQASVSQLLRSQRVGVLKLGRVGPRQGCPGAQACAAGDESSAAASAPDSSRLPGPAGGDSCCQPGGPSCWVGSLTRPLPQWLLPSVPSKQGAVVKARPPPLLTNGGACQCLKLAGCVQEGFEEWPLEQQLAASQNVTLGLRRSFDAVEQGLGLFNVSNSTTGEGDGCWSALPQPAISLPQRAAARTPAAPSWTLTHGCLPERAGAAHRAFPSGVEDGPCVGGPPEHHGRCRSRGHSHLQPQGLPAAAHGVGAGRPRAAPRQQVPLGPGRNPQPSFAHRKPGTESGSIGQSRLLQPAAHQPP